MGREREDVRMLGALLRLPFQAIVAGIHQSLVDAGYADLSPSHFTVFQHMPPEGARLTELARAAQITKQSMGYLVDYLAQRGYVERAFDPEDGRARLIRLTGKGLEIERLARGAIARTEADWAEHLGASRMRELVEILEDLTDIIADEQQLKRLDRNASFVKDQVGES